jgi:hypothetical protein
MSEVFPTVLRDPLEPTNTLLPGGEVYTDDRAPAEWLIDRSILGYASEEG